MARFGVIGAVCENFMSNRGTNLKSDIAIIWKEHASAQKIMERCFNTVDHKKPTAQTSVNFPIQIQVDDYV